MTALLVTAIDVIGADAQLAELGAVTLARTDAGISVACDERDAPLEWVLARAGAATISITAMPQPQEGCIPATATDLTPLTSPGIVDVIRARTLDEGEATERLRRARGRWPVRRPDRVGIRAILRDDDRLIAWRRIVWAKPSALRSRSLRGLRPVVFDRDGLHAGREFVHLSARDELTRWLRG